MFGASSLVQSSCAEVSRPLLLRRRLTVSRVELRALWRIGRFLLAAQLCYMAWNAADQVWVDSHRGSAQVGLYGSASNLSRVFLVLQLGVAGISSHGVAELRAQARDRAAMKLILGSMAFVLLAGLTMLVVVATAREPLLTHI